MANAVDQASLGRRFLGRMATSHHRRLPRGTGIRCQRVHYARCCVRSTPFQRASGRGWRSPSARSLNASDIRPGAVCCSYSPPFRPCSLFMCYCWFRSPRALAKSARWRPNNRRRCFPPTERNWPSSSRRTVNGSSSPTFHHTSSTP